MTTRVLMSPGREISNPFIALLQDNLDSDVTVNTFSWRDAFFTKYDVLHVHWPDALLVAPSPLRRARKVAVLLALILRNRILGVAHVWTVHNLTPHEKGGRISGFALRAWERSCQRRVYLSVAAMPKGGDPRGAVIKHGDYSQIVNASPSSDAQPVAGRLLLFGLLRQYKGIEPLIDAISASASANVHLRIAGRPVPESYGAAIESQTEGINNIETRLQRLSDEELVSEIVRSEIVVLPYKRIYNSGAALMALSAGRPIITTGSDTMRELQSEVGPEWVQVLMSGVTVAALESAVSTLRSLPRRGLPAFAGRDWRGIGAAYSALYRSRRNGTEQRTPPADGSDADARL
jgi:beta-1,4-mannosyltransferase